MPILRIFKHFGGEKFYIKTQEIIINRNVCHTKRLLYLKIINILKFFFSKNISFSDLRSLAILDINKISWCLFVPAIDLDFMSNMWINLAEFEVSLHIRSHKLVGSVETNKMQRMKITGSGSRWTKAIFHKSPMLLYLFTL